MPSFDSPNISLTVINRNLWQISQNGNMLFGIKVCKSKCLVSLHVNSKQKKGAEVLIAINNLESLAHYQQGKIVLLCHYMFLLLPLYKKH